MSERGGYRKQAPKQTVKAPGNPPGKIHPDWFWSMSGGIDSTAAYLLTRRALHENFSKRPVMSFWDTRIGIDLNQFYLEELADIYGEQLWTLRTEEKFEDWVANDDCPGGGAHPNIQNEVKGRQASKLNTLATLPVHVLGLRAGESNTRAEMDKVEVKDGFVEVRPVHRLTQRQCARIILEHEGCPINPFWIWPNCFSDCGCLANGDPSELDAVEEKFPWFAQRMREIEESAEADGLRGTLGWDGLTAVEKSAKRQEQEQATLNTCGDGCSRERDPVVVQAFEARIHGASASEAIDILDGQLRFDADRREVVVS